MKSKKYDFPWATAQALLLIGLFMGAQPSSAEIDLSNLTVLQRYSGVFEINDHQAFKSVNDLHPYRQRTIDIPMIEAELEVKINSRSKFEFEVEFEHGGTGSAMEFDPMEEFGEFEQEQERGGEVAIEEAYYQRKITNSTNLIVGKAPIHLSLGSVLRKPLMYSSNLPSNLEIHMLPPDWAEPGVQFEQRYWDLTARGGVVAGLNSEFFRKYNWIGGGSQRQFENMTFDDPAVYLSLEYGDVAQGRGVALSYYTGNTTDNRRLKDLVTKESEIRLWSLMGQWHIWRFGLLGQSLRGELGNANAIADGNSKLGGLAKPLSFVPIGSSALLDLVQLNYEFVDSWTLFTQYEHVNTFDKVDGVIRKYPQFDIRQTSFGIAHQWDDICMVKFAANREWTQQPNFPTLTTYVVQFAFDTGDF